MLSCNSRQTRCTYHTRRPSALSNQWLCRSAPPFAMLLGRCRERHTAAIKQLSREKHTGTQVHTCFLSLSELVVIFSRCLPSFEITACNQASCEQGAQAEVAISKRDSTAALLSKLLPALLSMLPPALLSMLPLCSTGYAAACSTGYAGSGSAAWRHLQRPEQTTTTTTPPAATRAGNNNNNTTCSDPSCSEFASSSDRYGIPLHSPCSKQMAHTGFPTACRSTTKLSSCPSSTSAARVQ